MHLSKIWNNDDICNKLEQNMYHHMSLVRQYLNATSREEQKMIIEEVKHLRAEREKLLEEK